MDNSFKDIFFWNNTLHVFDQIVSVIDLITFEVVDHQVKSCLRDHIYQGWKNLQSILTTSENDKVVTKQIIILKHITRGACVLQCFEFCLSSFSIVELEVVACFQVDSDD